MILVLRQSQSSAVAVFLLAVSLLTNGHILAQAVGRSDRSKFAGHWEGAFDAGQPVGLQADIRESDGELSGTVNVPIWGRQKWRAIIKQLSTDEIDIRLPDAQCGSPFFRASAMNGTLSGKYSYAGTIVSFHLDHKRVEIANVAPNTQVPILPAPYNVQEVNYQSGMVHLSASLLVPTRQSRPSPAVVLLGGHRAFGRVPQIPGSIAGPDIWMWILASRLSERGFVVLHADSRGIGRSDGNFDDSTVSDQADDAAAGVSFVSSRPEVDPRRIGLIGASMGGLVAPLAAARNPDAKFVVLIGTPALPWGDIVRFKMKNLRPLPQFDADVNWLLDACKSEVSVDSIRTQWHAKGYEHDEGGRIMFETYTKPLARSMLRLDPAPFIKDLRIPIFAIYGGSDRMVPAELNAPVLEELLKHTGQEGRTVTVVKNLDHSLRRESVEAPTIDEDALTRIINWAYEAAFPDLQIKERR